MPEDSLELLVRVAGSLDEVTIAHSSHLSRPAAFVADTEIAHAHKDGRIDVRLTRTNIAEMRAELSLDPRVHISKSPTTEWAGVTVTRPEDEPFLVELLKIAVAASTRMS